MPSEQKHNKFVSLNTVAKFAVAGALVGVPIGIIFAGVMLEQYDSQHHPLRFKLVGSYAKDMKDARISGAALGSVGGCVAGTAIGVGAAATAVAINGTISGVKAIGSGLSSTAAFFSGNNIPASSPSPAQEQRNAPS